MTDMASTSRVAQTPPSSAESGKPGPEAASPAGGGSSSHAPIVPDGQMTIISSRPPLPVQPLADGVSDSAARILQGRILPGDRLGHFELVQYIGGGGMGRVFRALDTRLARTVAVKVLSPDQAADRDTLLRFQNEAQSAARLDHDNIARVHYVGEDRGLHYIVFEFIAGVNIRELVESKGPLPLAEAISYTLQAAEALAHAARRNVVHRDIKPSNLLITPEGQVKLIDMGLARLREVGAAAADLTASGITLGTFDYISPEQARDPRNADVRSDLYSLGCTFFYMLTGRPPFPEGTVLQKLLQHQGDQPPDVRQFRPELPEGVCRVLRRTLAKDPRHRYAEPGEMVGDILLLAQEAGIGLRMPSGKTWTTPRRPVATFFWRHFPWAAPWRPWGWVCCCWICSGRRRRARNRCRRCRSPNRARNPPRRQPMERNRSLPAPATLPRRSGPSGRQNHLPAHGRRRSKGLRRKAPSHPRRRVAATPRMGRSNGAVRGRACRWTLRPLTPRGSVPGS